MVRDPALRLYKLDITSKRSEVVFTGRKRLRGTFIPREFSKLLIAAPTAVSSWITFKPPSRVWKRKLTWTRGAGPGSQNWSPVSPAWLCEAAVPVTHTETKSLFGSVFSKPLPADYLWVNNDLHVNGVLLLQPFNCRQSYPQIVGIEYFEFRHRLEFIHVCFRDLSYLHQPQLVLVLRQRATLQGASERV